MAPGRRLVREVTDTDGLDAAMLDAVSTALRDDPSIHSVYSVGGGNLAMLDRLRASSAMVWPAFVAHDLDSDNLALLRQRRDLAAVLHHDLRERTCAAPARLIMQARGFLPGVPWSLPSHIQVITPYNEPAALVRPD